MLRKIDPFLELILAILLVGILIISILVFRTSNPNVIDADNLPAFPGAQGFGSNTLGGRFGRILVVTNLNDTTDVNSSMYPGSLRWALESVWASDSIESKNQGRIIVFKVGGTITLADALVMKQPYVTLAGQTAPGGGIMIKGDELEIATHDVIVRGVRVRVGDEGQPSCCRDGIGVSTNHANSDVYNIIVDHSSVSWAIDENMSTWKDPSLFYSLHDITFQWNILSEGLQNSIHIDEGAMGYDPHSMGMILGQDGYNISVHHNLFSHNWGRNPRISGILNAEIINNVIYGWNNAGVEFSEDMSTSHILDNYFKTDGGFRHVEISIPELLNTNSGIFMKGNLTDDPDINSQLFTSIIENPGRFAISLEELFMPSNIDRKTADVAYTWVLNYAGAITPVRDDVDRRIIEEVRTGTGMIIDSQDQVGGWPDIQGGNYPADDDNDGIPNDWELAHNLNPNDFTDASNYNIRAPSGYTWVEEYINLLIPRYRTTANP